MDEDASVSELWAVINRVRNIKQYMIMIEKKEMKGTEGGVILVKDLEAIVGVRDAPINLRDYAKE